MTAISAGTITGLHAVRSTTVSPVFAVAIAQSRALAEFFDPSMPSTIRLCELRPVVSATPATVTRRCGNGK